MSGQQRRPHTAVFEIPSLDAIVEERVRMRLKALAYHAKLDAATVTMVKNQEWSRVRQEFGRDPPGSEAGAGRSGKRPVPEQHHHHQSHRHSTPSATVIELPLRRCAECGIG